jgi:hypothetical protein
MSTENHYFIERSKDDRYRVVAAEARRASGIAKTGIEAIAPVKRLNPDDRPDVSPVRNIKTGRHDKWRSADRSKRAA